MSDTAEIRLRDRDENNYWHLDCSKPENQNAESALRLAIKAARDVLAAFGLPGDFGYDTKQGYSLQCLCEAARLASRILKTNKESDAPVIVDGK